MKKPLFCLLTVLTPFLLLESTPAGACTNFIVTRGASTDSTTLVSYSADSHALYGCLYKFNAPKGGFRPGEMLSVYEWDTEEKSWKPKPGLSSITVAQSTSRCNAPARRARRSA